MALLYHIYFMTEVLILQGAEQCHNGGQWVPLPRAWSRRVATCSMQLMHVTFKVAEGYLLDASEAYGLQGVELVPLS